MNGEKSDKKSKEFVEASRYFAELGDEYIDDAFSVMHREDASIVGTPNYFKKVLKKKNKIKIGEVAKKEIIALNKSLSILKNKTKKSLAILSGAKISTKLPLIEKFLKIKSKIFVAGGIINQILKDILNLNIGESFYEKDFKMTEKQKSFLLKNIEKKNIILLTDILTSNKEVKLIGEIEKGDNICDIGPISLAILKNKINEADNIIMNGPLGIYEEGFSKTTELTIKELVSLSENKKKNILIGGGDTLFFTKKLKLHSGINGSNKNLYISTAGGAMLEFLLKDGKLPGIEVMK